jgi:error-prone DNA polymerase
LKTERRIHTFGERCLKSAKEMGRLFASYPEALANTIRLLDACSGFSLGQLQHEHPDALGRKPLETLADRVHAQSSTLREKSRN